jgi:hypothetical protein
VGCWFVPFRTRFYWRAKREALRIIGRIFDEQNIETWKPVWPNAELRGAKPIGEASLSNDVLGNGG